MSDTQQITATETTAPAPVQAPSFETETCSRCAGSGNYSYCPGYGNRCFKCSGKGRVYSKRGHAALDFQQALLRVPALGYGMRVSVGYSESVELISVKVSTPLLSNCQ